MLRTYKQSELAVSRRFHRSSFTGVAFGPETGEGEASWQNYLH